MLNNKEKLIELIELIEFGDEIKEIINLWDPMGLMDFCPEDEYETEVRGIRNLVVNNKNIDKKTLAQEIKNIFEHYFSNEYKSKQEIEEDIASKIIEKSKEYKLNFTLPNYYDTKKIIFKNQKEADIYINLYIKINKIINLWDPLKIMDISFSNEYSYEINRIIEELLKNISAQDLAEKINKIFRRINMELYDLTLKKEVAREGAWEILGRINKVEDIIGQNMLLELIYKKFGDKTQEIPKMTLEDVEKFEAVMQFLNNIFILLEKKEMEIKTENLKEYLTNLNYETIKNLIKNSKNDSEKNFYIDLLNLILQYQQEEAIKKASFNEKYYRGKNDQ